MLRWLQMLLQTVSLRCVEKSREEASAQKMEIKLCVSEREKNKNRQKEEEG